MAALCVTTGNDVHYYLAATDEWRALPLTLDDIGDCATSPRANMNDVVVNRETGVIYIGYDKGIVHGVSGQWGCWRTDADTEGNHLKKIELAPNGDV